MGEIGWENCGYFFIPSILDEDQKKPQFYHQSIFVSFANLHLVYLKPPFYDYSDFTTSDIHYKK